MVASGVCVVLMELWCALVVVWGVVNVRAVVVMVLVCVNVLCRVCLVLCVWVLCCVCLVVCVGVSCCVRLYMRVLCCVCLVMCVGVSHRVCLVVRVWVLCRVRYERPVTRHAWRVRCVSRVWWVC
jgi:hypothetical protein